MEIYKLEISFPYDDNDIKWSKTIEVKEDFTIEELHLYIQELVEFENDHLYRFYVEKNHRRLSNAVSEETELSEIYPMTGYKLYYLFDFGDEWLFQIKKSRKKQTIEEGVKYPRLIQSTGTNPEQYPDYEE